MNTTAAKVSKGIRITWAIAAKDIVDAIKNKTTLSQIITVLFVIVLYHYLPNLENSNVPPRLAVYDAGNSELVPLLEESSAFDLVNSETLDDMERFVGDRDMVVLGVTLPVDFDQILEKSDQVELDGYVVHWASVEAAAETRVFFESQIAELAGKPVYISTDGNTVYTRVDSRGLAFLASITMVLAIMISGIFLVPLLMIEEKQSRTIDVLQVSPASSYHVVAGKALAGLFYCLTVSLIVLVFNRALINHWGLAFLAVICGSLFGVGIGLLLGSIFKVRQQLTLWGFFFSAIFLIPVFLSLLGEVLPKGMNAIFNIMPTVALTKVLRISFSESSKFIEYGPDLSLVMICALVVFALVTWVVQRQDR